MQRIPRFPQRSLYTQYRRAGVLLRRFAFKQLAHFKNVVRIFARKGCDDGASVRFLNNQVVFAQGPNRFVDGRAADVELSRQLDLADHIAWQKVAGDDGFKLAELVEQPVFATSWT